MGWYLDLWRGRSVWDRVKLGLTTLGVLWFVLMFASIATSMAFGDLGPPAPAKPASTPGAPAPCRGVPLDFVDACIDARGQSD